MTVKDALKKGTVRLRVHRCAGADAARDAELLLVTALRTTKEELATRPGRRIPLRSRFAYARLLARRRRHAPIAHLTGWAWFCGRRFRASRCALIPRPATETIIGQALAAAGDATTVIDVGTGSGVIATTCALERPDATVFATDVSRSALRLARKNAMLHGVEERILFVSDDLIRQLRAVLPKESHTLIIANLPYLPDADRDDLSPDVAGNEPPVALYGGTDGLDPARRLIDQIAEWRGRPPVTVAFELLAPQADALIRHANKKMTGLSAGTIHNDQGMPIGVILTVR